LDEELLAAQQLHSRRKSFCLYFAIVCKIRGEYLAYWRIRALTCAKESLYTETIRKSYLEVGDSETNKRPKQPVASGLLINIAGKVCIKCESARNGLGMIGNAWFQLRSSRIFNYGVTDA